jgi:hypothetical protein
MKMRRLTSTVATTILVAAGVLSASGAAHAYGGGGHLNVYQIAISFNCNNKAFCGGQNLGGFWGWAEVDENVTTGAHTGDAQLTGCSHGTFKGAAHTSIDVTDWWTAQGSAGPTTLFTDEVDTTTYRGHKDVQTFTNNDTGIPLVPGHHSTSEIFGFNPPPGVSAMIQVSYKPAH